MNEPAKPTKIQLLSEPATPMAPSADLWPRIVAARERTLRGRRRRRVVAGASGFAIGIACFAALLAPRTGSRSDVAALAAGQRESQALEAQWRAIAAQANPDSRVLMPLRGVDAALQSAYERHAAHDEIETLWAERNRTLNALILHNGSGGDHQQFSVTRI